MTLNRQNSEQEPEISSLESRFYLEYKYYYIVC